MSKEMNAAKAEAAEQPMKTLASCTTVEFLRQTNKIRHCAGALLKKAGVAEIRKRRPQLTGDETKEEKEEAMRRQGRQNFSDMLDALMDTNAEDTAALLGMMCFQEPGDMEGERGMKYLEPGLELLMSRPVMDFLLTLSSLA